MEDLFVWMLMFAGATIGLLATFLIGSERELKKRRVQLDQLLAKVENSSLANSGSHASESPAVEQAAAGQQPGAELTALSTPNTAEIDAEIRKLQERLSAAGSENSQLRAENAQLQREKSDLELELENNRAHMAEADGRQDTSAERCAQLTEEIARLRDQLGQRQSEVQRLADAHEQLGEARAAQLVANEQQKRLERELTAVQTELSEARHELESARNRMRATETVQYQLEQKNQRLQDDLSSCYERLDRIDSEQARLHSARERLKNIRGEHAACSEAHRLIEQELTDLILRMEDGAGNGSVRESECRTEMLACSDHPEISAGDVGATDSASDAPPCDDVLGADSSGLPAISSPTVKRRRFGLFPL